MMAQDSNICSFVDNYKQFLISKAILAENGECLLWTGYIDPGRYGKTSLDLHKLPYDLRAACLGTAGSKRFKSVRVHRLALTLAREPFSWPDRSLVASHLCHNKTCILATHLTFESNAINNTRKSCLRMGRCLGHHPYKDCMLNMHLP